MAGCSARLAFRTSGSSPRQATPGAPWGPLCPSGISIWEMDLARSIQLVTEEVVLRLARTVQRELEVDHLCLAGGVALNCVANGRLLREAGFQDLWIQPAAGDAGGALGAALSVWHQYLGDGPGPLDSAGHRRGGAPAGPHRAAGAGGGPPLPGRRRGAELRGQWPVAPRGWLSGPLDPARGRRRRGRPGGRSVRLASVSGSPPPARGGGQHAGQLPRTALSQRRHPSLSR